MTLHNMCADIAALLNPIPAPAGGGDESEEESYAHAAEEAWQEREDMAEGLRMSWAEEDIDPCCPPSPPCGTAGCSWKRTCG
jgi:hypothetical protein